jgi:ankyrin repeat protein
MKRQKKIAQQSALCRTGIENNNPKQVELALMAGADVNDVDSTGKSLFYLACKQKNNAIYKLLITHKDMDVYARDSQDYTPLHVACALGLSATVTLILHKTPQAAILCTTREEIPLHIAASCGKKDCVTSLLAHDIRTINHQNTDENSALHLACWVKHFSTIQLLIEKGANPTIINKVQTTPLICLFSAQTDYTFLHAFFIKNQTLANIFIHTKDTQDNSQFHLCTAVVSIDVPKFELYLQFLLRYGLDIHARNKNSKRAIDLVCEKYNALEYEYHVMKFSNMKNHVINQAKILHIFLQVMSPHTPCALFKFIMEQQFKQILEEQNINNPELPKELIAHIINKYYVLNIETVIANKYKQNRAYCDDYYIENRHKIRQQQFINPKPKLLWSTYA